MDVLDLGSGFSLSWTSWRPDRALNPQYADLPDVEKFGALLTCRHGIEGSIMFDHGEAYAHLFPNRPRWQVLSWEPLTLTPSIATGCCHGYITEDKWVE
jgi:hypothetical protein